MRSFDPNEPRNASGEWSRGQVNDDALRALFTPTRAKVQTPTQFRHPSTGALMGKTEIGDTFERMFAKYGAHMLESKYGGGYSEISVKGDRTTPLDFQVGNYGGELKTLNVNARSQKTAIKKEESARKRAAVEAEGLNPLLVVQVVDMETMTVNVYSYEGFPSKAVSKMEKIGSYKFGRGDFRAAQKKSGHWSKRYGRAAIASA